MRATGSVNRIAGATILAEPLSFRHGEITDRNSINRRALLTHRSVISSVERMQPG
jgi:feruloyl-CoA synthase